MEIFIAPLQYFFFGGGEADSGATSLGTTVFRTYLPLNAKCIRFKLGPYYNELTDASSYSYSQGYYHSGEYLDVHMTH